MAQIHEATTIVRMADDRSITETVIFAVAEVRDLCASKLEPPLYEVIDGEALRQLLSEDSKQPDFATTRVEFDWAGCTVVVHGTGRVVVTVPAGE